MFMLYYFCMLFKIQGVYISEINLLETLEKLKTFLNNLNFTIDKTHYVK